MKFVSEFRDPLALRRGLDRIRGKASRPWVIMDVCGGQTHSLLRHGIETALEGVVELIHGPGCPVCVTPEETIDAATTLALRKDVILASFGDMLAVPGRRGTLLQARARGGDVRAVYSPVDAVALAAREPERLVVFLAVGFETTAPATALAVLQAQRLGLENFRVLVHHVRVEPAMRAVIEMPGNRVHGFLAAGHVCTVTGYSQYEDFAHEHRTPIVVTGFEPLDLLAGLERCVALLEAGRHVADNQYSRCVRREGNQHAQALINSVFEVSNLPWRGFGAVAKGGLALREEFSRYDMRRLDGHLFEVNDETTQPRANECRSGEVLSGRIKPPVCPLFGTACTPESPVGAPMVSSEGACAAYYRYSLPIEVPRG